MSLMNLFSTLLIALTFSLISQAATLSTNFPFTTKEGVKVSTLVQLNAYLKANYTGGDVNVYILPGTYTGSVSWTFQATSGTLKISGKDAANLPVFDGCLKTCIEGESGGFFMRLQDKSKTMSNIVLQKIKIQNYVNGILIAGASNVTVSGLVFEKIGTAFNSNIPLKGTTPAWGGYSALMTDLSTGLKISGNTFLNCYNNDNPLWFHAIYLKSTESSTVSGNKIDMISGDPIRLRHECSNIKVTSNTIQNSGMAPVTTFEQVGEECPSIGIKASSNTYGMMFPYNKIYSQAGFNSGWAKKAYLNEGMQMGQGYKVTIDPALSPSSCAYRKVVNKWQVFTSNLNTFVLPTIDTRIASRSTGVVFSGTGSAGYASMAKDSNLVLDTNMFFVGCNSESTSTCQNNGTSSIADDKDPFNEDKASEKYLIRLKLKMGTAAQKIQVTGGQLKAFAVTIPAVKVYDSTGWAVVELPVSLVVSQRSQAILQIKTLGAGLKIQSVQIAESN